MKKPISFRLSEEAHATIRAIAYKLGISQSATLEIALREKARREKTAPFNAILCRHCSKTQWAHHTDKHYCDQHPLAAGPVFTPRAPKEAK